MYMVYIKIFGKNIKIFAKNEKELEITIQT